MPQIFINDRPIGGYTDLAALESSGRLRQRNGTLPADVPVDLPALSTYDSLLEERP